MSPRRFPSLPTEVFPQQMEGVKLIVNKALSSHFQVLGGGGTQRWEGAQSATTSLSALPTPKGTDAVPPPHR